MNGFRDDMREPSTPSSLRHPSSVASCLRFRLLCLQELADCTSDTLELLRRTLRPGHGRSVLLVSALGGQHATAVARVQAVQIIHRDTDGSYAPGPTGEYRNGRARALYAQLLEAKRKAQNHDVEVCTPRPIAC